MRSWKERFLNIKPKKLYLWKSKQVVVDELQKEAILKQPDAKEDDFTEVKES